MKNVCLLFLLASSVLVSCGRTEKTQETTAPLTSDTVAATRPEPKNCQTVVDADKLGKSDTYQESAKSIKVTLTLDQDTSATQTASGCYFNNTVTVLAVKKSGSRVFKRTLLKDDLLYFTKSDDVIEKAVLQRTAYKPTFNGQKYITLTMHLLNPVSKKTADYIVFMNYFGEIVKVK